MRTAHTDSRIDHRLAAHTLSPRGRGCEAMTYGHVSDGGHSCRADWSDRKSFGRTGEGRLVCVDDGPLIRSLGPPLLQEKKYPCGAVGV